MDFNESFRRLWTSRRSPSNGNCEKSSPVNAKTLWGDSWGMIFNCEKLPAKFRKIVWSFHPFFRSIKNCYFIILVPGSKMCMAIIQWNLSEWSKKCFRSNKWLFKMQLKPRPVSLIISPAHYELLYFAHDSCLWLIKVVLESLKRKQMWTVDMLK